MQFRACLKFLIPENHYQMNLAKSQTCHFIPIKSFFDPLPKPQIIGYQFEQILDKLFIVRADAKGNDNFIPK